MYPPEKVLSLRFLEALCFRLRKGFRGRVLEADSFPPIKPSFLVVGVANLKNIMKESSLVRHLRHLRREGKQPKMNFMRSILVRMKSHDLLS